VSHFCCVGQPQQFLECAVADVALHDAATPGIVIITTKLRCRRKNILSALIGRNRAASSTKNESNNSRPRRWKMQRCESPVFMRVRRMPANRDTDTVE